MNYTLAKELKDAGYPLRRIEAGMCVGPWPVLDMNPSGSEEIGAQHFYAPTLEELIDACGGYERFSSLEQLPAQHPLGKWAAWIKTPSRIWPGESPMPIAFYGQNPTEAVARLYLQLMLSTGEVTHTP